MSSVQNSIVFLCLFLGPVLAAMLPPLRERPNAKLSPPPIPFEPVFLLPMSHRLPSAAVLEARERARIRRTFPPRPSNVMLRSSRSAFRNPSNPL